MLLPGAGFDVVPSDCLAAHLNRRLPTATRLVLGIRDGGGRVARHDHHHAGRNRERTGRLGASRRQADRRCRLPPRRGNRLWRAAHGRRSSCPGVTSRRRTIARAFPTSKCTWRSPAVIRALQASRYLGWLIKLPGVMALLSSTCKADRPARARKRAKGLSLVWGRVEDDDGNHVESRLQTPEGYTLTALSSLAIVRKVLAGQVRPGFQTPSSAFGPDLVMEIPGVAREDL